MNVISSLFRRNSSSHAEEPHVEESYFLSGVFETAVEAINTVAGIIILVACVLAGINLIIVSINSMAGLKFNSKKYSLSYLLSTFLNLSLTRHQI